MPIERICKNCSFFHPEPGVNIDGQSILGQIRRIHERKKITESGGMSDQERPVYGKCTAYFHDINGEYQYYDAGKLSTLSCDIKDGRGNLLFSPR